MSKTSLYLISDLFINLKENIQLFFVNFFKNYIFVSEIGISKITDIGIV